MTNANRPTLNSQHSPRSTPCGILVVTRRTADTADSRRRFEARVPAHATAGVEHRRAGERAEVELGKVVGEIRRARRLPVGKMRPLVAEARLRAAAHGVRGVIDERRNAAANGRLSST